MRLLHTSDWHLGRTFHGASLVDEQSQAIDRIVEISSDRSIDLVIVAGDLYDRAFPPAEAVYLFDDAIARLRSTGARVVAISGNHDSNIRVGVYDRIMAATGVTIRGDIARAHHPVIVQAEDGGPPLAVYAIPYLDPTLAGPILQFTGESDLSADDMPSDEVGVARSRLRHDDVTRLVIARIASDLATRAGHRSVVVAHSFVEGGLTSESERDLTVGNIEVVGVETFGDFDYIALGHLHRSQERDGPRLAYSGSPLPYSFSEENDVKSVRIVDLPSDGKVKVEVVALGVGRPLRTIEGNLEDLLRNPRFSDAEQARVRAFLTDPHLPMQAMSRLHARFPHAVELRHRPDVSSELGSEAAVHSFADGSTTPIELINRFWADQHGADAATDEAELLINALTSATRGSEQ